MKAETLAVLALVGFMFMQMQKQSAAAAAAAAAAAKKPGTFEDIGATSGAAVDALRRGVGKLRGEKSFWS